MKGGDQGCADLKTTDKLRARLPAHQRLVARAHDIIREGLALCRRPYVAFSGGKDSEVVLHLVLQHRTDVDVVWLHSGAEFPDTEDLVERLRVEWRLNLTVVRVQPGLLDLLEEYGAYGLPARTPFKKGDLVRRLIYEPSRRLCEERGFDAVFMGLRKEESRRRLYSLTKHGPLHLTRYDGLLHINPLADWQGEDVWAYINGLDLPYNAVYDKTLFQPREWVRTAPWAGGIDRERGRFQFMRYYYPDLFNEFARRFPNVRLWA